MFSGGLAGIGLLYDVFSGILKKADTAGNIIV
jgi:hypothetical protein